MIVVVMGVAASGKSRVATVLAERTGWRFIEGDELHPQSNRDKMTEGTPLTDADRWPWLDAIGGELAAARADGQPLIVTCSALKRSYRQRLRKHCATTRFLFLHGDEALLQTRMARRQNHFMPPSLLPSQLATLEVPADDEPGVHCADVQQDVASIVDGFLGEV